MKTYIKKIKKAYEIGPIGTTHIFKNRLKKKYFTSIYKKKALAKQANHNWNQISKSNKYHKSFCLFFEQLKKSKETLIIHNLESNNLKNITNVKFQSTSWHEDLKIKNLDSTSDYTFTKNNFYNDIKITVGNKETLAKDVKNPWELSRFQHLPLLGKTYSAKPDETMATYFVEQISDWINENPFLLGINWLCPMEVGIRAINWMYTFSFFCNAATITKKFWEKFFFCKNVYT